MCLVAWDYFKSNHRWVYGVMLLISAGLCTCGIFWLTCFRFSVWPWVLFSSVWRSEDVNDGDRTIVMVLGCCARQNVVSCRCWYFILWCFAHCLGGASSWPSWDEVITCIAGLKLTRHYLWHLLDDSSWGWNVYFARGQFLVLSCGISSHMLCTLWVPFFFSWKKVNCFALVC